MDDVRFGELSKAVYTAKSRRQAFRLAGTAAAGGVLSLVGAGPARADTGRCKKGGWKCRENSECCSGFCNPATAECACPPGSNTCATTGACVTCGPGQVFNTATCACECPTGTTTCGNTCCPRGQVCAGGQCCINEVGCTTDADCCPGFSCNGGIKGSGLCVACTNPPNCKTTSDCCSGFVCASVPGQTAAVCTPAI
jgi:hypothetical protein